MINKIIDISEALNSLRPNNSFAVFDNQYETIEWFGPDDIPTKIEVEEEIKRLTKEKENTEYQQKRIFAYPSIQEQLDMIYWDSINGTQNWISKISEIKDKYPKGK